LRIRKLAQGVANSYLASREKLGFPLKEEGKQENNNKNSKENDQ